MNQIKQFIFGLIIIIILLTIFYFSLKKPTLIEGHGGRIGHRRWGSDGWVGHSGWGGWRGWRGYTSPLYVNDDYYYSYPLYYNSYLTYY